MVFECIMAVSGICSPSDLCLFQCFFHLLPGEFMQLGTRANQDERFNHYIEKSYRKTASLVANSCQAVSSYSFKSNWVKSLFLFLLSCRRLVLCWDKRGKKGSLLILRSSSTSQGTWHVAWQRINDSLNAATYRKSWVAHLSLLEHLKLCSRELMSAYNMHCVI